MRNAISIVILLVFTSVSMAGTNTPLDESGKPLDPHIIFLILYVLVALIFSFLCSIAEATLLSITPSYIEDQKEKYPGRAAILKKLKEKNIDQSLAAILTLNTIAHTIGAIGAGAQASLVFGNKWFGLFSAGMTLMILFLSEIIPKTLGAIYWSYLAGATALFVQSLIWILYPIVWCSEKVTKLVSHGKTPNNFNRDELMAMARVGAEAGDIQDNESRIIHNLLQLRSVRVSDVMTPITVVHAISENTRISDAIEKITQKPFSRIPVFKTDIDNITGFVLRDDILLKKARNQNSAFLKSFKRDILIIPGTVLVSSLLERFLKHRQHIAMVVDEHGRMRGLVTLEDLIETLIGVEIMDEIDKVEDMRAFARNLWMERAKALGIDESFEKELPENP
ncbi:MAG: hemolysin family protein [Thermodesulfobacteriota bacterium]|nr:hemolysin family protein [Thermodesulfobacteriota bacterium]